MTNTYLFYYCKVLYVDIFPSYGSGQYYNKLIYNHFFELLVKVNSYNKEFDYVLFMDKYINKLESNRYKNKFSKISESDFNIAKKDFLEIQNNIYQIMTIHANKYNPSDLKQSINLSLNNINEYSQIHKLSQSTITLIINALKKVLDVIDDKMESMYKYAEYNAALLNTIDLTKKKLEEIEIKDIILDSSKENTDYQSDIFKKVKTKVLNEFNLFTNDIEDIFTNNRKINHLSKTSSYIKFLFHDKIQTIETPIGKKKVFLKFYKSLYDAHVLCMYFFYFKNKFEKATISNILKSFDNVKLEIIMMNEFKDNRLEELFFKIIKNIKARADIKYLSLIILGHELLLEGRDIQNIVARLNAFENNNEVTKENRKHKRPNKNKNFLKRFNELKYYTNMQIPYEDDENTNDYLNLFCSFKTEVVYRTSIIKNDGESNVKDFNSVDEYKKYIMSLNPEDDIQYLVDNYLREEKIKVYYNPLVDLNII